MVKIKPTRTGDLLRSAHSFEKSREKRRSGSISAVRLFKERRQWEDAVEKGKSFLSQEIER